SLPIEVQFAPLSAMQATDFDKDGNLDLLVVGNDFSPETLTGRYDASIGTVLQGDGKGNFKVLPLNKTGFLVKGDAKTLTEITLGNGKKIFLITRNRDNLQAFEKNNKE
ncbi:MAG: hypothetical protein H7Y04_12405, partial [Verrucomicrobia bacterium]|nr:hypothetical protein [Cytophagales bacterium]